MRKVYKAYRAYYNKIIFFEDSGFVMDTAEAICQAYEDDNVLVRIKTSWSLGNLSDALVLNRYINKSHFRKTYLNRSPFILAKTKKSNKFQIVYY